MKGRVIDITTAIRPNPDGTIEGIIAVKSTDEVWGIDGIAWKTDSKQTKLETMDAIINNIELMKVDIDRCISVLKMEKQKIE